MGRKKIRSKRLTRSKNNPKSRRSLRPRRTKKNDRTKKKRIKQRQQNRTFRRVRNIRGGSNREKRWGNVTARRAAEAHLAEEENSAWLGLAEMLDDDDDEGSSSSNPPRGRDRRHWEGANIVTQRANETNEANIKQAWIALSITELKHQASAAGATQEELDDADDSDNIRAAIIKLIEKLNQVFTPVSEPNRPDLLLSSVSELKQQARAAGATHDDMDDADDSDDTKAALIDLIEKQRMLLTPREQQSSPIIALGMKLSSDKVTELKQQARDAGATEDDIDEVDSAEDSLSAVLSLLAFLYGSMVWESSLIATRQDADPRYRHLFNEMETITSFAELKKLASMVGVTQDEIDEAQDTDNHEESLIDLIIRIIERRELGELHELVRKKRTEAAELLQVAVLCHNRVFERARNAMVELRRVHDELVAAIEAYQGNMVYKSRRTMVLIAGRLPAFTDEAVMLMQQLERLDVQPVNVKPLLEEAAELMEYKSRNAALVLDLVQRSQLNTRSPEVAVVAGMEEDGVEELQNTLNSFDHHQWLSVEVGVSEENIEAAGNDLGLTLGLMIKLNNEIIARKKSLTQSCLKVGARAKRVPEKAIDNADEASSAQRVNRELIDLILGKGTVRSTVPDWQTFAEEGRGLSQATEWLQNNIWHYTDQASDIAEKAPSLPPSKEKREMMDQFDRQQLGSRASSTDARRHDALIGLPPNTLARMAGSYGVAPTAAIKKALKSGSPRQTLVQLIMVSLKALETLVVSVGADAKEVEALLLNPPHPPLPGKGELMVLIPNTHVTSTYLRYLAQAAGVEPAKATTLPWPVLLELILKPK